MPTSILLEDFQFSQGSLQDFKDCPRRFLLRHIEDRAYPAAEAEPIRVNERRKERGIRFHELLCQACSGVSPEAIARQCAGDETLTQWWERYREREPVGEADKTWAEVSLEGQIVLDEGNHCYPLVATYDLIARRSDGTFEIFDWKTSEYRPSRDQLSSRLQTTVYPYLLAEAGGWLNGGDPPAPENIEMTYWFARHPGESETFEYGEYNHRMGEARLAEIVRDIASREERSDFEKTSNHDHCRYCTYRSYCGRGKQAGNIEEAGTYLDETESLEANLETVEEIKF